MKILVTANLPEECLRPLQDNYKVMINRTNQPMPRFELLSKIFDKDGLLCMISDRIDEEVLAKARNLKMIANCGVGYDNIDVRAATARGIKVSNTPDVVTNATADLTFSLMMACARRIVEADRIVRAGEFSSWTPFGFLGTEVSGKILGIVGMGAIGKAVARRAKGFNMPVLYFKLRRLTEAEELELNATYVELPTLLKQSDYVSLHVDLNEETRGLIGKEQLYMMKPSAFLINVARGPVLDESALVEALRDGVIKGAGLDVYQNEPELTPGLTELRNVVLLPHIGTATIETRIAMADLAVRNLIQGLTGQKPVTCVNCQ
ncbi:MAG: 2-hydroxyacid dehydrogenase [Desulfomonilaceae bacterium]